LRSNLKDKGSGGVADAGVLHVLALAALGVLEELETHLVVALILQSLHGAQHHSDRMATAYRVVVLAQVLGE